MGIETAIAVGAMALSAVGTMASANAQNNRARHASYSRI